MARLSFLSANAPAIDVPILNGFLMAIRREVFDAIGYMVSSVCAHGQRWCVQSLELWSWFCLWPTSAPVWRRA